MRSSLHDREQASADVVGADIGWIYDFHVRHLSTETRHHYDNIGFSSGVPDSANRKPAVRFRAALARRVFGFFSA